MRRLLFALIILIFSSISVSSSNNEKMIQKFSAMSLQELLSVKVKTGTFTELSKSKLPLSLTIISKEDIQVSTARNIFDLIEIYVPSATFTNHWLGHRVGIRGISGDQNLSFLVLLNGLNINTKYQGFALSEVYNKDLNDIEKVEIIRGPGSVRYGSGAIAGVINIITKKDFISNGIDISARYNPHYRTIISSLNLSYSFENIEADLYASISKSDGESDPKFFYIDRAHGYGYGFMDENWGNKGLGTATKKFYSNFWDRPEVKVNLDMNIFEDFHFWARYSDYSFIKQQQSTETADGMDIPGYFGKQFIGELENNTILFDSLKLLSTIGFISMSKRDVNFYQGKNQVSDHITQRNFSYSENTLFAKTQFNYSYNDLYSFALGADYEYTYYSPEWGMDDNTFILPFQYPIRFALYDSSSAFYKKYGDNFCTILDDKLNSNFFSLFFEANLKLSDRYTLLVSARTDKNEYSKWAFSPRLALISEIDKNNVVKIIAQESVRLPAFIDLYSEYETSATHANPEVLKGLELIYSRMQNENMNFTLSTYYHTVDQIAWLQEGKNGEIGQFDIWGLDLEFILEEESFKLGANYSIIKQLSWSSEQDIEAYLDVDLESGQDNIEKIYFENYAENRVNNFPLHSIKLFYNQDLFENLTLHFDCRFNFDYQQEEMLLMFKKIHDENGAPESKEEMMNIYNTLHDNGYAENSFTSNISLIYDFDFDIFKGHVSLFAANIFSINHIRYVMQYWETGNLRQYPRQVGFIKEDLHIGFSTQIAF